MEPNRFRHYIGIDWATEAHRICLLDHNGQLVARTSIPHSGAGLGQLLEWLASHGVEPAFAAVAIETPRGAVVETLVERHYTVFAINPKQLARFRDRYTSAGAKDDDRDAWVLASALRTDEVAFQRVAVDPAELIQLRELHRTADELREEVQRLTSRLREQFIRYYPQMLALYPSPDQPVIWDLLELAPLPATAQQLTLPQVEAVLRKRRIRRLTAGQVLEQLRATPLTLANGAAAAASEHALILVAQLRVIHELRKQTLKRLTSIVTKMRQTTTASGAPSDAAIIASLPGAGVLTTAALLSESSRAVAERDGPALRAYAGVAPVTQQSGKSLKVSMRYACNNHLRNAFYHFAMGSLRDPVARRHYDELRAKGHSHARALRGVADRWVTVLVAMLRSGTLYDATRRKACQAADAQEAAA
ncbi:MAG TPA: IS110 family transposase [Bryobacteraceae bacterium]|nr:IS110 family transposase [Bryobacteraceae bacterium]